MIFVLFPFLFPQGAGFRLVWLSSYGLIPSSSCALNITVLSFFFSLSFLLLFFIFLFCSFVFLSSSPLPFYSSPLLNVLFFLSSSSLSLCYVRFVIYCSDMHMQLDGNQGSWEHGTVHEGLHWDLHWGQKPGHWNCSCAGGSALNIKLLSFCNDIRAQETEVVFLQDDTWRVADGCWTEDRQTA